MTPKTRTRGANSFKKALLKFNTDTKRTIKFGIPHRFSSAEAHEIYQKYGGKCVYCGTPLNIRAEKTLNALHFRYYTALEHNGAIHKDNVVTVCTECEGKYKPTQTRREDIPDIDSFADTIQILIETVVKAEAQRIEQNPEYVVTVEKIRRIKFMLNLKMEDIATNMRYKPFKDWMPSQYEIIEENNNSFPDLIEKQSKNVAGVEDLDALDSGRERIVEQTKQIISTKQYKVIRNTVDEY